MTTTAVVLGDIVNERKRQDETWGEQNHPNANHHAVYPIAGAAHCKQVTDMRATAGVAAWADILIEEVAEAVDEARAGNREALRQELIQAAAVAVCWVEQLDRVAAR